MLILVCPEIDVVDGFEPALVVKRGGELGEPWPHAIGDGVERPDADLGAAGDAVLPAVLFFEADAEEADDWLVAHGGAIFLGGFADEPGRGETVACLTIGGEHRRATADLDGIEWARCATSVIRDHAGLGVDSANLVVPKIDDIDQTLAPPFEECTLRRVLRICRVREIETGGGFEVFAAVLAIAIAGAVPAVHEYAVSVVASHDLFMHGGHELEVVRAEGTGDPHLGRGP